MLTMFAYNKTIFKYKTNSLLKQIVNSMNMAKHVLYLKQL